MINPDPKFKKLAIKAARIGDAKKAENVVVYRTDKNSSLADYTVVMSADSVPQLEALQDSISKDFKEEGLFPLYKDGDASRSWRVMDYGGLIIHIFETGARGFYVMDELFDACPRLSWKEGSLGGEVPGPGEKRVSGGPAKALKKILGKPRRRAKAPKKSGGGQPRRAKALNKSRSKAPRPKRKVSGGKGGAAVKRKRVAAVRKKNRPATKISRKK